MPLEIRRARPGGKPYAERPHFQKVTRTRTLVVGGAAVALVVALSAAYLVQAPRAFPEWESITLSGSDSPPWQQRYCAPDGTWVNFAWHTNDASFLAMHVWTNGWLGPGYQYNHYGSGGGAEIFVVDPEYFTAADPVSTGVSVVITLSFTVNGTYGSGPAAFGAC
jgi:hypothetical protein